MPIDFHVGIFGAILYLWHMYIPESNLPKASRWKWLAEIVFWTLSVVIAILIMKPVHDYFGTGFKYYTSNYAFIILFFTYTRYLFLLKFTPFSHNVWVKVFLVFASIPLMLWLIDDTYDFRRMLDEEGLEPLVRSASLDTRLSLAKYAKYEFVFFSTSAILTIIMVPIRMIVSIWRVRNKKDGSL